VEDIDWTTLGRSRSDYKVSLDQCITEKCASTVALDQVIEKSMTLCRDEVPLDLLCPRSKATPGRLSPRSEVPLGRHKKLPAETSGEFARGPSPSDRCELSREEAKVKVRETIAMVN